jgi:uncharacterized protein YceK
MKQKRRNGILLVALAIIVLLSGCGNLSRRKRGMQKQFNRKKHRRKT